MSLTKKLRVEPGSKLDLSERDPRRPIGVRGRAEAEARTEELLRRLYELQYVLYAESKQSLLIVLQAMDAGGKDSTIRKVMGGLNPQGCRVTSFKKPSTLERSHDPLWRIHAATPRAGEIAIFNRSHYEDVLVVRVHDLVPKKVWSKRYRHINDFERMLSDSGTRIVKFFLHISKEEQRERFQDRLDDPNKHWKASEADFAERQYWDDYQKAFEVALQKCSTKHAPWYVIPADRKWYRNLAVAQVLVDTLEEMDPRFPEPALDASSIRLV